MSEYGVEVLAKTPGLFHDPTLRNFNLKNFDRWRDGQTTDGRSDLYYPLVADKRGEKL